MVALREIETGQTKPASMWIERFLNVYSNVMVFIRDTIHTDELASTQFDGFLSRTITYSWNLFPTELSLEDSDDD